jgi:hypothetical protein
MFRRGECRGGNEKKTSKKRLTIVMRSNRHYRSNVGAGLLANAVYQSQIHWLTLRFREQARSHN